MALARALAVEPKVLLLDEPFGALDAKVRAELRAWLRRLHDEVHVTTVLVTHDQEEAMDVADQHRGHGPRRDRAGRRAARALRRSPANEFVMGFLGPVSRGRRRARAPARPARSPLEPDDGAREAQVERVVHLGFEVRVELALADGERRSRRSSRAPRPTQLELAEGAIVWVRSAERPAVPAEL